MGDKYMGLLVTPRLLWYKQFDHFHYDPSVRHIGTYQTLFRMRMLFFWPKMREDIKCQVSRCAPCILYNVWEIYKSQTHFSWNFTITLQIIHVDLSWPDFTEDDNLDKAYLKNSMCDVTQFVSLSPTTSIDTVALAQLFMSDVLLYFGVCSILVIDDGSTFQNASIVFIIW